jgi:LMBR1-like membrane protein
MEEHGLQLTAGKRCRLVVLPAKGVSLQVKAVVGVAWLTTLIVCCVVPIDIYSTLASKNPEAVDILWDMAYWSTQLLTWALIPVYMGYADAGEFTWRGKMMASVKFNALFFVLMVRAAWPVALKHTPAALSHPSQRQPHALLLHGISMCCMCTSALRWAAAQGEVRGNSTASQRAPSDRLKRFTHPMHTNSLARAQLTAGVVGITLAIMSGRLSLTTLPSLGMQLSNTFALFCVLVLLSYGLVALPRNAWKRSFPEVLLRRKLFKCAPFARLLVFSHRLACGEHAACQACCCQQLAAQHSLHGRTRCQCGETTSTSPCAGSGGWWTSRPRRGSCSRTRCARSTARSRRSATARSRRTTTSTICSRSCTSTSATTSTRARRRGRRNYMLPTATLLISLSSQQLTSRQLARYTRRPVMRVVVLCQQL